MTENIESLPWRIDMVGRSAGNAVKELADVFRGATTCWLFFCSSRRPRRGLVKKGLAALSARLSADPLPSRALSYLLWRDGLRGGRVLGVAIGRGPGRNAL